MSNGMSDIERLVSDLSGGARSVTSVGDADGTRPFEILFDIIASLGDTFDNSGPRP